jgi:hypothetical protein
LIVHAHAGHHLDGGIVDRPDIHHDLGMGAKVIFMPPCLFCMENH